MVSMPGPRWFERLRPRPAAALRPAPIRTDRRYRRNVWRRSWLAGQGAYRDVMARITAERLAEQHAARRRPWWYPAWAGLVWAVIVIAAALAVWALVGALLS